MATAKPDIIIKSIRGRIGNVVFYANRGRQCVRTYVVPRNPDTVAQRAVRRAFGDAVRSWQAMSPDEQYTYTRKARHLNMSGYNLYISNCLKRIMHAANSASIEEPKSKNDSPTWNLELATWNSLPSPSVSPSYMLLCSTNSHSFGQEPVPG